MHKAPVREACLFEGEMGALRCVILGEDRSRSRSQVVCLHVDSHSQSLAVEIGKIRVVFARDEHSFGKHQLFEIYEETTSSFIPSADSNEKNRNSLEKRAMSLMQA